MKTKLISAVLLAFSAGCTQTPPPPKASANTSSCQDSEPVEVTIGMCR